MRSGSLIYNQNFKAGFHYPVLFSENVFSERNPLFAATLTENQDSLIKRALVFIDSGVGEHHPELIDHIKKYFTIHHQSLELAMDPQVVQGGEKIKNDYRKTMGILDTILEHQMCRHSYIIAIGGGAVLDAVGFAASIVHRGLRMVRLPTTVLAQNDAGIGVKNGMNLHGGKNTIGTFHPPFAVINDAAFLATLSETNWRGGISEAFKVAIIKDQKFLGYLLKNANHLNQRDPGVMKTLIWRCAKLHLDHIRTNGDPFELGTARPLDFGHWSAHKLETMSNYKINHGQAVAMGIALDSLYAVTQGGLTEKEAQKICNGLLQCGLPLWYPEMGRTLGDGSLEVLQGVKEFQEHLGGELCITLPDGIGQKQEIHEINFKVMAQCIDKLRAYDRVPSPTTPL